MTRIRRALCCSGAALAAVPPRRGRGQPASPAATRLRLNDALRTLAQNPNSVAALVGGGEASLGVDDIDAALGFFRRAAA